MCVYKCTRSRINFFVYSSALVYYVQYCVVFYQCKTHVFVQDTIHIEPLMDPFDDGVDTGFIIGRPKCNDDDDDKFIANTTIAPQKKKKKKNKKKPNDKVVVHQKRVDWAPEILTKTLALNLGYSIGGDIAVSQTGLRDAGILLFIIVVTEFFLELMWIKVLTQTPETENSKMHTSQLNKAIKQRVERLLVITRYFAITAVVSAFNGVLKPAIYKDGDVASIIVLVVVIYVVATTVTL